MGTRKSECTRKIAAISAAIVLGGFVGDARPADVSASAAFVVSYAGDRLTVRLQQADPKDVIQEVARQSGATIRGIVANRDPVGGTFAERPLADGLKSLLRGQSFALRYDVRGNLRQIELLGGAGPLEADAGRSSAVAGRAKAVGDVRNLRTEHAQASPEAMLAGEERTRDAIERLGRAKRETMQAADAQGYAAPPLTIDRAVAMLNESPEAVAPEAELMTRGATGELLSIVSRSDDRSVEEILAEIAGNAKDSGLRELALRATTEISGSTEPLGDD